MIVVMGGHAIIMRMRRHQAAMRHGHQGTDQDEDDTAHAISLTQRPCQRKASGLGQPATFAYTRSAAVQLTAPMKAST